MFLDPTENLVIHVRILFWKVFLVIRNLFDDTKSQKWEHNMNLGNQLFFITVWYKPQQKCDNESAPSSQSSSVLSLYKWCPYLQSSAFRRGSLCQIGGRVCGSFLQSIIKTSKRSCLRCTQFHWMIWYLKGKQKHRVLNQTAEIPVTYSQLHCCAPHLVSNRLDFVFCAVCCTAVWTKKKKKDTNVDEVSHGSGWTRPLCFPPSCHCPLNCHPQKCYPLIYHHPSQMSPSFCLVSPLCLVTSPHKSHPPSNNFLHTPCLTKFHPTSAAARQSRTWAFVTFLVLFSPVNRPGGEQSDWNGAEYLQPWSLQRGCLSLPPAHLVVVLVAVLHRWTIQATVFLCKTSKQRRKLLCKRISEMASFTCSSGCLALTQYYVIAEQGNISKAMEKISWKKIVLNKFSNEKKI